MFSSKQDTEKENDEINIDSGKSSARDDESIQKLLSPHPKLTKKIFEEKKKDDASSIYSISYKLLAKRVEFLFPRFIFLEKKLRSAAMPVPFEAYVCGMVLLTVVAGVIGLVTGIVISIAVRIQPPEFGMLLPFILGSAFSQATFGIMYMLPKMSAGVRAKKISEELPYFLGYMATLASSGLTLEGIFKTIAKEQTNEHIVADARYMARNIDVLGMDIITAINDLIRRSPPGPYTELLEGLISAVQSGGDLKEYFIATAKVQLEEKKLLLRKMTSNLGMVAEMYTILLVVFPLMAIIMLSIMAIMTPNLGGMSLPVLMNLLTYAFVPIFGIMMLIMMDSMIPKR
ncbi:MAG: type II secretion system F family protein [Nitrosopumilaceae archaeon]